MSHRKRPPAKPTVFKRPYKFDRSRSLSELHGWSPSAPSDGLGLIGRYTAAVDRPVGQLSADELLLLFMQHTNPHYLVPVTLDFVRRHLEPRLLFCLIRQEQSFWREHPALCKEIVAFFDDVAPQLPLCDADLAREAAAFVQRQRGG